MHTGVMRCPRCNRLIDTYDYRIGYHWAVPGARVFGVPGVAVPFGCEGGGTVDKMGREAAEKQRVEREEREAALAAFRAGDHGPLWRLDPWEAHVREGGD